MQHNLCLMAGCVCITNFTGVHLLRSISLMHGNDSILLHFFTENFQGMLLSFCISCISRMLVFGSSCHVG